MKRRIASLIPAEFAEANGFVPLDVLGRVLAVASLKPLDSGVQHAIFERTGLSARSILCSGAELEAAMRRFYRADAAVRMPEEAGNRLVRIARLLEQVESFPALPGTVYEVEAMVRDEGASSRDLGALIERDPAIAAKTLRIANSAAYGLRRRVDNVTLAVGLLGMAETYTVVLSSAVADVFGQKGTFDYVNFWMESAVCAAASRKLARRLEEDRLTGVFSAGLLRDIGRLALLEADPDSASRIDSRLQGLELCAAERVAAGIPHTDAGHFLAHHWGLPDSIAEAIRFHHAPQEAAAPHRVLVEIVSVADAIARAHRTDAANRKPDLSACGGSLERLGLSEADAADALDELRREPPLLNLHAAN